MTTSKYILVADDDAFVAETVSDFLQAEGYACRCVDSGEAALEEIGRKQPDLIVIDRMMPGSSGDDVVRALRSNPRTASIPIIMLSGKAEETDELVGLALGADDYIPKPFTGRRLTARVSAVLRRSEQVCIGAARSAPVSTDETLDQPKHRVWIGEEAFALSPSSYRLFSTLVAARGFVLDAARLTRTLFGADTPSARSEIKAQLDDLKQRLGSASECLQDIDGVGYAFCPPPGSVVRM